MDPTFPPNGDDDLLDELRDALAQQPPVPDAVMDAAKAAFEWRTIDEELELLSLSYDSSLEQTVMLLGPALDSPRMLVFDGEDLTIELEVGDDVVMGQVVPPHADRIVLESADGRLLETDADDAGFFLLRRPPRGPVRLQWHGQGSSVVTQWMTI